jgi:putative aldouronate transport system permease protein
MPIIVTLEYIMDTTKTLLSIKLKPPRRFWKTKQLFPLYLMLLPTLILLIIFSYLPMYGIVIAFQNFKPLLGVTKSPFVGFDQFQRLFSLPDTWEIFRNTLVIAVSKLILGQLASLTLAILLHEVTVRWFKGLVQTCTYVLNFLSWVIFGGILIDMLLTNGLVNQMLSAIGLPRIPFLTDPAIFPVTLIVTDVWKGFGFGAVIYLAALTNVDPVLYEAAAVDGANRWHSLWHVTIPSIIPIIVLVACLNLGSVLNAGFEQVLVLYNTQVMSTGDIIDTFVYRVGLQQYSYSFETAVGLLKSVISMGLISISYYLASRYANYRIF